MVAKPTLDLDHMYWRDLFFAFKKIWSRWFIAVGLISVYTYVCMHILMMIIARFYAFTKKSGHDGSVQ